MADGTSATAPAKVGSTSELFVPLGIVAIVLMMVIPLPRVLIDALLAFSLALSIGVFLIGLFMEQPLQFSAFPAVILVATLMRLSVNVATTRLILLNGAKGHGAAGQVVEAFGRVVVGGNILVGLVVFLILVVINFVVITKGAGRVAEVAARFALDGMPGKQMAIDADLNGGMITAEVARDRRRSVEREADFFGAMDGASKFTKGDAIAGLLITAINLIGGLLMGLASGMTLAAAAETFSILSVGDALVSQLPALLVSTAAGVVVTRSATGDQLGRALEGQLLGSRRAVTSTAGVLTVLGLLPGMPGLPFWGLAALLWWSVRRAAAAAKPAAAEAPKPATPAVKPGSAEDIDQALPLDVLALEVGFELVHAVDPQLGGGLIDRIAALRKQTALDLGVVIPAVHIRDNLALPSSTYRFLLLGTEIARGALRPGRLLAMDSGGNAAPIDGEETRDPAFGVPARWIPTRDRELAEALGHTVVDHTTILATHLSEVVRAHAHEITGRSELQHLFDVFSRTAPKLVEELVPNLLSFSEVLRVFRNLLKESVSVRDVRTLVETLVELAPSTRDPEQLTELVRQRLARQITSAYSADGTLTALVLDHPVEDLFRRSLREIAQGTGGSLDPDQARRLGLSLEASVKHMTAAGKRPCVVVSPDVRRYVRAFAERRSPTLAVLSFREIDAAAQIKPFETVQFAPA